MRTTTSSCARKIGPAYMVSKAKQVTKLASRSMINAKRRSKRPTAFHRSGSLVSVPVPVRVLVFTVAVVVAAIPATAHTHTHTQTLRSPFHSPNRGRIYRSSSHLRTYRFIVRCDFYFDLYAPYIRFTP